MKLRRIVYAWALLGSLVFYWAYREWLSWFLLVLIVLLPWFSLLVSLPAILSCRAEVSCPQAVTKGADLPLLWLGRSPYPLSPVTGKLTAENTLNRLRYRLHSGDWLPTEHCGQLSICVRRPRCCDYLGLFVIPIGRSQATQVLVCPSPIQPEQIPDMRRYQAHMWRPKPGGGFSENHELRLYRPGDSLKQVHWKLSAKTGQLITREPLEPVRSTLLLTLCLQGTPEQLDSKLGQLLWLSSSTLPLRVNNNAPNRQSWFGALLSF